MGTRKPVVISVCLPKVQPGSVEVNYSQQESHRKTEVHFKTALLLSWFYISLFTPSVFKSQEVKSVCASHYR